jgi:hypothetical protein
MSSRFLAACAVVALVAQPGRLAAQDAPRQVAGTAYGVSVGDVFGYDDSMATISFRATRLNTAGAGFDFAFTTLPGTIPEGSFFFAQSAGVALQQTTRAGSAMLRAGGTAAGGVGNGGGGGMLGVYMGGSVLINSPGNVALRVDVTRYSPLVYLQYGVIEISAGITKFPKLR